MKEVSDGLKIDIANYKELESFTRFGSDLDKTTLKTLESGQKTIELLKQDAHESYSLAEQVISLFCLKYKLIDDISVNKVRDFEKFLLERFKSKHSKIMQEIESKKVISDNLKMTIAKYISEYVKDFNNLNEE